MQGKREQILEAAEGLFAEKGFEGTSVRELAKKARINIAMISYYFGSKEKLFESLVAHRTGFLREKLKVLNSDESLNPMAKIEKAIDIYVDRIFSSSGFHKILHREMMLKQRSDLHDGIADILILNAAEVKKLILEGQKKGFFRKVDVDLIIVSVIGTITQCTMSETLTMKLLKIGNGSIYDTRHKNRLKNYLKELIRSYLLNKNYQSS